MKKGDLARLNVDTCFTKGNGGSREYTLTNSHNDDRGVVEGFYILTKEQRDQWYQDKRDAVIAAQEAGLDTFSISFDDGGESRLCPSEGLTYVHRDRIYPVLRARARAVYNYHRRVGLAVILDTENGREIYVKRDLLETLEKGENSGR
tara:strand:- start:1813 stop:2256 length:444 start_codon:yes stop_codon:yes gene_type:complete